MLVLSDDKMCFTFLFLQTISTDCCKLKDGVIRSKDFVWTLEKRYYMVFAYYFVVFKNHELWRWPSVHDVLGTCSFWALVKTASCCQGLNFQCVHSIECKMNREEDALVCVWAQRIITHFFHHRRSNWFLFSWGMTTGIESSMVIIGWFCWYLAP